MMVDAGTIRIDDPQDPRIEDYRDIRERDLVKRQGMFIAEGKTVLQVLLRQDRFPVRSLLILETRLAGIRRLLDEVATDVPVYVASQPVIDAIAGFHMHRGILALGAIPAEVIRLPERIPRSWETVLVLSGIANHDNIGAIFRNAAAFGADAVLLDSECCDPLYRKAIRVSVGGVLRVPYYRIEGLEQALSKLTEAGIAVAALSPSGSRPMEDWEPSKRQAIVLGSEGHGLAENWLRRLDTVSIRMAGGFDSLNVATSGAIALFRLQSARARA
jgi:tRNA G18 (ribose-2'-O)-methylase SpoU